MPVGVELLTFICQKGQKSLSKATLLAEGMSHYPAGVLMNGGRSEWDLLKSRSLTLYASLLAWYKVGFRKSQV